MNGKSKLDGFPVIITDDDLITMTVSSRRELTPSIVEFVLKPEEGGSLPEYGPGAHITVETPSGAMRRYSLVGGEANTYTIAVKREPESRGGSQSMHDEVAEGNKLRVAPPENDTANARARALPPMGLTFLVAGPLVLVPTNIIPMTKYSKTLCSHSITEEGADI